MMTVSRQHNPDKQGLKLSRGLVALACQEGVSHECQRRSESGIGGEGDSSEYELCRREGTVSNLYYRWSKDFLEAGKKRLQGDTAREATSSEVGDLRSENDQLKQLVAELSLKNRLLKKSQTGLE
jgi:transposase-like protein